MPSLFFTHEFGAGEAKRVHYFGKEMVLFQWRKRRPRFLLAPQKVELPDESCWFFPELNIVRHHCGESREDLVVKLMIKYPNLCYSTSVFVLRYYRASDYRTCISEMLGSKAQLLSVKLSKWLCFNTLVIEA